MNKAEKAAANRLYRARKAIKAGRKPGVTGRPPTGHKPRRNHHAKDRSEEYRKRNAKEAAAREYIPAEMNHPIMDAAQKACEGHIKPDRRTVYNDGLYEEAMMSAALAIIEGTDPEEAVVAVIKRERSFGYHQAPLLTDNILENPT